jgi:DNA-binding NtrC family response regulator
LKGTLREARRICLQRSAEEGELLETVRRPGARGPAVSVDLDGWTTLPSIKDARAEFDRRFLKAVLARYGGNITRASEALGMQRSNLSRMLKRIGS